MRTVLFHVFILIAVVCALTACDHNSNDDDKATDDDVMIGDDDVDETGNEGIAFNDPADDYEIWVGGGRPNELDDGILLHYKNGYWKEETLPYGTSFIRSLAMSSRKRGLAVTEDGKVLFYDGQSWKRDAEFDELIRYCTPLTAVATAEAEWLSCDNYVGSNKPNILVRRDNGWESSDTSLLRSGEIYSLRASRNMVYGLGSSGGTFYYSDYSVFFNGNKQRWEEQNEFYCNAPYVVLYDVAFLSADDGVAVGRCVDPPMSWRVAFQYKDGQWIMAPDIINTFPYSIGRFTAAASDGVDMVIGGTSSFNNEISGSFLMQFEQQQWSHLAGADFLRHKILRLIYDDRGQLWSVGYLMEGEKSWRTGFVSRFIDDHWEDMKLPLLATDRWYLEEIVVFTPE
ncbi:MAG TPA: hypothetical protein PKW95_03160 [bacterium]|nr:hypothetical protein [bacterium]